MNIQSFRSYCRDCEWENRTADKKATQRSAVVHGWLKPGYRGVFAGPDGEWVR